MKRVFTMSALFLLMLSACKPAGKEPIKIGLIAPLTGDAAALGVDIANGVKLAIEEVNTQGGIGGRQVELKAEDGRCTPNEATNAAQKLVNVDKVVAILGGQCSGETLAAAPIAEQAKIILLSSVSSSPNVTEAGAYVYRNYPSDALKTKAMARYFQEKGYGRIAILTTNAEFSIAFRDALKQELGDQLVFDEVVEPDTKDVRSVLSRLKDVDFDVFIPNGHAQGVLAPMVQQFRELGFIQLMVSHDIADTQDVLDAAGEAAEGMQVINVQTLGEETDFGKKFTAKFGAAQSGLIYAAHGYDAARVLMAVMKDAGTEGPAMKDALDKLSSFEGVIGAFHFDENGDVKGLSYALKEVQQGAFVKVQDIAVD